MNKFGKIVCFAIGIVFLLSGLGKVVDVYAFQNLIVQYGFKPFNILAPAIAILEVVLGMLFLLRVGIKPISWMAFGLLLVFSAAYTYGYFVNGIADCGCFGPHLRIESPSFTYVRNLVLIAGCLYLIKCPVEAKPFDSWRMRVALTVFAPSLFLSGATFRYMPLKSYEHPFQGMQVDETALGRFVKADGQKRIVSFISYDCPHCWNSIANFKDFENSKIVDEARAFVVVDNAVESSHKDAFLRNFTDVPVIETPSGQTPFVDAYPTSFYVDGDTIRLVMIGTLPSPYVMRDYMGI